MRRLALTLLVLCFLVPAARAGDPPPAGTNLSGREFRPKKILLYDRPKHHELQFVEQGSADCSADFGHHMWLHVSRPTPFVAGEKVSADDKDLRIIWSTRKQYDPPTLALTFDKIDPAAGVATGRLELRAPDGTDFATTFEARYCGSREVPVAEPPTVHGLTWSLDADTAPSPKKLPKKPAQGVFLGKPFVPAFVSVAGYEKVRAELKASGWKMNVPPVITFFAEKPADPCVDHLQATGDRFVATLDPEKPLQAGLAHVREFTDRTADGTWWSEPEAPRTLFGNHEGVLSVRIDAFDKKKRVVKGRIYLAVKDASKSLLVGSFVATYCKDPTGA